jgi:DNA ligase (NAD+)
MTASNLFGHGLGSRKLSLIINNNPNILQLKLSKQKFIDKIIEIDGFDTKTATQFVENIDKFKQFLNINKKIKVKIIKKTTKKNGNFKDKKIVFTGFRDKELEALIETEGGKLSTSVSSNTDYLVTNDKNSASSKVTKAKDLGIEIFLKDEFIKKFKIKLSKDI